MSDIDISKVCSQLDTISTEVGDEPSETILKMLEPIARLEKYVADGGIIGDCSRSSERSHVEDSLDRIESASDDCDWADPLRKRLDTIHGRIYTIKESSRENEGGDGWLTSDCYGHEYDNWLASGC